MFETRITELFGIEYPVIGGCMQYITGPEFVASICNAGALGTMSSAMFYTQQDFRAAVRRLKGLTDRPFAVNLNLFPALRPIDNRLYAEVILEEGVPIVETSGNRPPPELIDMMKSAGVKTMHKCTNIQHALSAQSLGVDAVTLFGHEGGGHIADLGLTTLVLVPRAVDDLEIPVIAAGGIADGRGLLAALALGAGAAMIGTRLLLTVESPVNRELKRALVGASELDTLPILGSVHNTLRAWKNDAAMRAAELESAGKDFSEILEVVAGVNTRAMMEGGDVQSGVVACSEAVGLMSEIKTVADLVEEMVGEAEELVGLLSAS
jgi:nitronate monooxygenase